MNVETPSTRNKERKTRNAVSMVRIAEASSVASAIMERNKRSRVVLAENRRMSITNNIR